MAGLLVSVRSTAEARAALEGGAAIIDVKEPDRGSLGCADASVWEAVRESLPAGTLLSLALGELAEWSGRERPGAGRMAGFAYRKLGLAGAGAGWEPAWAALRRAWGAGPAWVAVAYSDWQAAGSPRPDDLLGSALASGDCAAVLVDTWDKTGPNRVDSSWLPWFARARAGGLKTALAGGLDEAAIGRLAPLCPDWFAVRGAACRGGDRRGTVDAGRVSRLARQVARLSAAGPESPRSY